MLSLINSTRSFHICRVVSQMPISLHMFKGTSEQLRAMNIFDLCRLVGRLTIRRFFLIGGLSCFPDSDSGW